MSFIHNCSSECAKDQLDLFAVPSTQLSIENSESVTYKPIASIDNDSPIEFIIPPSVDEYTDVSNTFLHLVVSIVNDLDEKNTDAEDVGCINNLLHSIFSDVCLTVGTKAISAPSHLYPYRAYLESLFNYNETAKGTHQTLQLFYKDTPGKMNELSDNVGFQDRKKFFAGGKTVAMYGKVNVDLFGQSKYLLNRVPMSLTLTRSKNSFMLMTSTAVKYKIQISSASLNIRRVRVSPGILVAHAKVLNSCTAKYPINRVEMKSFTIPSGLQIINIDNVLSGQLPVRVIVGFVKNTALNGHYKQNPFNFQHFSLNYICLTKDGVPVSSRPLQPRFLGDHIDYNLSYYSTFSGTGINTKDDGYGINRHEYAQGYTLHAWDLTSDSSADSHQWSLRKHGTLGLELHFDNSLAETISCILYSEYQSLIEIDRDRRVTTDF